MSLNSQEGIFGWDPKEVPQLSARGKNIAQGEYLDLHGDLREMSPGLEGWSDTCKLSLETTYRAPPPEYNPYFHCENRTYQDWRYSQTGQIANWQARPSTEGASQYLPSANTSEHPLQTARDPINEIYTQSQYDGTSRFPSFDYNPNNAPSEFFASGNFHDRDINAPVPVKRVKRDGGPDTGSGMGACEFPGAGNTVISREWKNSLPLSSCFTEDTLDTRQSLETSGPSLTAVSKNRCQFAPVDPSQELISNRQSQLMSEEGGSGTTTQSAPSAKQCLQPSTLSATLTRLFGTGQPPLFPPVSTGPAIALVQANQAGGSQKLFDPLTDSMEGRERITVEDGNRGGDNAAAAVEKREGEQGKNGKALKAFKFELVEYVKNLLAPTWKEGRVGKEDYKTIVKKVVDKVIATIQPAHLPQTQEQTDSYLSSSKPKLVKLVQAYIDKYQNRQV